MSTITSVAKFVCCIELNPVFRTPFLHRKLNNSTSFFNWHWKQQLIDFKFRLHRNALFTGLLVAKGEKLRRLFQYWNPVKNQLSPFKCNAFCLYNHLASWKMFEQTINIYWFFFSRAGHVNAEDLKRPNLTFHHDCSAIPDPQHPSTRWQIYSQCLM